MSLYVVATPIGNDFDLGGRARELLLAAQVVVGEEHREVRRLLKIAGAGPDKAVLLLNEHSRPEDIVELTNLAKERVMVLVSDCGTPGFCDPGSLLVASCRRAGVEIQSVPGPSSLMALLSILGHRLDNFYFAGFLPANREERARAWRDLKTRREPIVLMDTPYRLERVLTELCGHFANRRVSLGMNLSTENECVAEGPPKDLLSRFKGQKNEFLIVLHSKEPEFHSSESRQRSQAKSQGRGFAFSRKKSKRK